MAQGASLKPGAIDLCITRAASLHGLGRYEQCLEQSREAIGLDPSDARGWMHAAWALSAMGDFAAALEHVDAALARDPASTWGLRLRSGILGDLGRHAEALESAVAAARIEPDAAQAHHRRAVCLSNLGRFDDAGAAIRTALDLDPENGECWATLAWVSLAQVRSDHALEAARRAVALCPEADWAYHRLGDALAASAGDVPTQAGGRRALSASARRTEAVRAFATALRLEPTHPYPRQRLLQLLRTETRGIGCVLLTIWGALLVAAIGASTQTRWGIGAAVLVAVTLPLVFRLARRSTLDMWEREIPGIRQTFAHLNDEQGP